jgi:hypothetical protein
MTMHDEYFDLLRARAICPHETLEGELQTMEQTMYAIKTVCFHYRNSAVPRMAVVKCYEMNLRTFAEWFMFNCTRTHPEMIVSINREVASNTALLKSTHTVLERKKL